MADPHDSSYIPSSVYLDDGSKAGQEPPCRNAGPESVTKRQHPGITPRIRLPALLVAVALTIMVLMSACGPDAPTDSLPADQANLAAQTPEMSEQRIAQALTAHRHTCISGDLNIDRQPRSDAHFIGFDERFANHARRNR